jgi:hypothetical protein
MRIRISIVLSAAFVLVGSNHSQAALVDVWDGTHGTVVTSASATDDFFLPHNANIANMFIPKVNVARPAENDALNTLFADTKPAGFVHFVEWQTPAPVRLGSFDLFTVDDHPSFNRSTDRFILYAWNGTSFQSIFNSATTHPYTYDDPAHVLLFSRSVTPITTDRFRAEFIQNGTIASGYMGTTTYGPRVLELAGYAAAPEAVPLPAAFYLGLIGVGMVPLARRWVRRSVA